MTYLLLFIFGIGVGALSGLLCIGGGVALVPGLILLFGFSQKAAQGTSLAILSLPVVIFAAYEYYKSDNLRLDVAGWIALGFVVGAYVGGRVVNADIIPPTVLSTAFGVVLLYVGFMFVIAPGGQRLAVALPAGLATLFVTLLGWVLRRNFLKKPAKLPPPSDDVEYHL